MTTPREPCELVDAVEAVTGALAPPRLRELVDRPRQLVADIRELRAVPEPDDVVERATFTAGRDRALIQLRSDAHLARRRAGHAVDRHADDLLAMLQPVHAKLAADAVEATSGHDVVWEMPADQAARASAEVLDAWRATHDVLGRLHAVEALADRILGPSDTVVAYVDGTAHKVHAELNRYGSLWWDGLPVDLERVFESRHITGREPSWADCIAAGARRVLRTRAEAHTAAIEAHNRAVDRCATVGTFGQSTMSHYAPRPAETRIRVGKGAPGHRQPAGT